MTSSIIYRSDDDKVILLDLPLSIENGQVCRGRSQSRRLLCPIPLSHPFPSTEPKGAKREELLARIPQEEREYHQKVQELIQNALGLINCALLKNNQPWCFPRQDSTESVAEMEQKAPDSELQTPNHPAVMLSEISNYFPSFEAVAGTLVFNPCLHTVRLFIEGIAYFVPPRSSFLISDLALQSPINSFLASPLSPSTFDVVLMDPPWSNRSVKHSRAYQTPNDNLFSSLLKRVESLISRDGLIAIWVTNKSAIRSLVINTLQESNFYLAEEWVWAKVTDQGLPPTALDGIWRRPYEALLIFRNQDALNSEAKVWPDSPPRWIIASVPAHHSQKPCLKDLIESSIPNPDKYCGLEIFARNLTAGWCSWGDQVLKFNCERCWSEM